MGGSVSGTYYDVLGVPEGAPPDDIERAYRDRIKQVHPDRNEAVDAAEQFRLVRRAREVLSDPDERARYDRLGHDQYVTNAFGGRWRDETRDRSRSNGPAPNGSTATTTDSTTGSTTTTSTGANTASTGANAASTDTATPGGTATDRASPTGDDRSGTAESGDSWAADTESASGAHSPGGAERGRAARRRGAADWQQDPRARAASGGSAYAVRREHAAPQQRTTVGLSSSRSMLALATFIVYPGLLYSSVAPSFPAWVNVIVFLCTLLAVGAILTDPEVGMIAFGAWLLAGPFALSATGVGVISVPGAAFMLACLVPFAMAVTARFVLEV